MAEESKSRWLPLESNPDVLNKYADSLGMPQDWRFVDVFGLESELLAMVPRPVIAVILLYPITEKSESQQLGNAASEDAARSLYFIKQSIDNACGTIGMIHALVNNEHNINLDGSKSLASFLERTRNLSPVERGQQLEADATIGSAHEESALEGQTEAPPLSAETNLHFVAFVRGHHDNGLYEFDGRSDQPKLHGQTSSDTFLEDTAEVVRNFMLRDPGELKFSVAALAAASAE